MKTKYVVFRLEDNKKVVLIVNKEDGIYIYDSRPWIRGV